MASYISSLKDDLANGFSKRELEVLIGLPKNSLASILTGKRNLSLKSQLKIKRWEASEKPNPLDLKYRNVISEIDPKAGDTQFANQGLHESVLTSLGKPISSGFLVPKNEHITVTYKHPLWKEDDPKEGSMGFYLKYNCYSYDELEKL